MNEEEQDPLAKTRKYYNLIRRFSFPSLKKVLVETLVTAMLGCGFAFWVSTLSTKGFAYGCLVGILVFAIPSILVEATLWRLILRNDPLFHLRRCLALSFVTNLVWITFLMTGMITSGTEGGFPQKLFLLGMVCAYSLRSFVVFSLSSSNLPAKFIATLSQPLASLLVAIPILGLPATKALASLLVAATVSPALLYPLLSIVERRGKEAIGVSAIELFRAFLIVFLDMKNEPLESYLEKLGVSESIDVAVLAFKSRRLRKTKAVIVVSNFHPGPFLNVGSSVLPTLIQERVEAETGGVVMVPHGVSGHERNVVSQAENEKIIQHIGSLLAGGHRTTTATKMVRSSAGSASATYQAFGEFGLVTLTTSPKDMEDIPTEVSSQLNRLKIGDQGLALIDSHNCISELKPMTHEDAQDLIASGERAAREASRHEQSPFKVGASKLKLTEFSLDQGIGPCGISVVLTEVDGSKSAYITVDGNNMKAGLREDIIGISKRMGIDEAEVTTTDTHMVSARVSTKLGYHPVGEAIDKSVFLLRVEYVIKRALEDLEDSEAEWNVGEISVKTLGRRTFVNLSLLIRNMSRLVAYWSIAIVVIPILFGIILLG